MAVLNAGAVVSPGISLPSKLEARRRVFGRRDGVVVEEWFLVKSPMAFDIAAAFSGMAEAVSGTSMVGDASWPSTYGCGPRR